MASLPWCLNTIIRHIIFMGIYDVCESSITHEEKICSHLFIDSFITFFAILVNPLLTNLIPLILLNDHIGCTLC